MKKFITTLALFAMVSCATTKPVEKPAESPDVAIKKPDGSKVTMSYEEFAAVKSLADRYVALQRRAKSPDTKIEEIELHQYRITIVLDDKTVVRVTFRTE